MMVNYYVDGSQKCIRNDLLFRQLYCIFSSILHHKQRLHVSKNELPTSIGVCSSRVISKQFIFGQRLRSKFLNLIEMCSAFIVRWEQLFSMMNFFGRITYNELNWQRFMLSSCHSKIDHHSMVMYIKFYPKVFWCSQQKLITETMCSFQQFWKTQFVTFKIVQEACNQNSMSASYNVCTG